MHAISNKAVETWLRNNTDFKDVKFNDMVPNVELKRDKAWESLDREIRDKVAESNVGIYQYTFHRDMVFSIHSHNAAISLSTMGDWVEKP